jgi:CRISPR-associated protein Csx17
VRTHLERVSQKGQWAKWSPDSTSVVWSNRGLAENLAGVLIRRLMESERVGVTGCSLRARVFAPLEDVVAFLNRHTNDERLTDLLWALIGVNWTSDAFRRREFRRQRAQAFRSPQVTPVPAALALIRLTLTPLKLTTEMFQTGRGTEPRWRVVSKQESATITTTPTVGPFHILARGDLAEAEDLAARRLWSDRIVAFGWANRRQRQRKYESGSAIDPVRLLAACLFPLSSNSLTRLARKVLNPPIGVS